MAWKGGAVIYTMRSNTTGVPLELLSRASNIEDDIDDSFFSNDKAEMEQVQKRNKDAKLRKMIAAIQKRAQNNDKEAIEFLRKIYGDPTTQPPTPSPEEVKAAKDARRKDEAKEHSSEYDRKEDKEREFALRAQQPFVSNTGYQGNMMNVGRMNSGGMFNGGMGNNPGINMGMMGNNGMLNNGLFNGGVFNGGMMANQGMMVNPGMMTNPGMMNGGLYSGGMVNGGLNVVNSGMMSGGISDINNGVNMNNGMSVNNGMNMNNGVNMNNGLSVNTGMNMNNGMGINNGMSNGGLGMVPHTFNGNAFQTGNGFGNLGRR